MLTVFGAVALSAPLFFTLTTTIYIGVLVLAGGLFEFMAAFQSKRFGDLLADISLGLIAAAVGAYLLAFPGRGMFPLTVLIGTYLLVEAAVRAWIALMWRPRPGWGWSLLGSLLTATLGLLVLSSWPGSALWLMGTMVGFKLFGTGIALVLRSFGARSESRVATVQPW
jgi:uncharacterized membrane protein HdeD (DUF308 family)